MESFVEDLLNLQMIRSKVMSISKQTFDVRKAVSFVLKMFSIKADSLGIDLQFSCSERGLKLPEKLQQRSEEAKNVLLNPLCLTSDDEDLQADEVPRYLVGDERRFK